MALFGLLLPCSRHQVYHHLHLVVCIHELRHVSFWCMIDLRMTTRTMRHKRVQYLNLILVIERLDHCQSSPDKPDGWIWNNLLPSFKSAPYDSSLKWIQKHSPSTLQLHSNRDALSWLTSWNWGFVNWNRSD